MIDSSQPATPKSGTPFVVSLSAALVAACRYIPLPFIDDYIEKKVLRQMTHRILARRGMSLPEEEMELLYHEPSSGVGGFVKGTTKKLLFKPVKKLLRPLFFVFSVRGTARKMGETILLGRAIDLLAKQDLPRPSTLRHFREAYEEAMAEADVSLTDHFEGLVDQQKNHLKNMSTRVKMLLDRDEEPTKNPPADLVHEGAEVEQRLRRPEVEQDLERFDEIFQEKLKEAA